MTDQDNNPQPTYYQKRKIHSRYYTLIAQYGRANIVSCWLADNNLGRDAFTIWLHQQYLALPKNIKWSTYCLVRKNTKRKWSPNNAHLITLKEHWLNGRNTKVSEEKQEEIIQFVKDNPGVLLRKVAEKFPYSLGTLSKILKKALGRAKNGQRAGVIK